MLSRAILRVAARVAPRCIRLNSTALAHAHSQQDPDHFQAHSFPKPGVVPNVTFQSNPSPLVPRVHKDDIVEMGGPLEPVVLSDEQEALIDLLMQGENVFFTGKAGTGKTEVLRQFVSRAKAAGRTVAVTSATGIAASHIDGTTLHSFMTMSTRPTTKEEFLEILKRSPTRQRSLLETQVLVIDEVSMVQPEMFDTLEYVCRHLRKIPRPFGGMQVVFCGDFHQLPPVNRDDENERHHRRYNNMPSEELEDVPLGKERPVFIFQSKTWAAMRHAQRLTLVELTKIFRQKEPEFIDVLNRVRAGVYDDKVAEVLAPCRKRRWADEAELPPTLITAYRARAKEHNEFKLSRLPGEEEVYTSEDVLSINPQKARSRRKGFLGLFDAVNPGCPVNKKRVNADPAFTVDYEVKLKVGAQVILMRNINIEAGLVNGARGTVVSFDEGPCAVKGQTERLPVVHFPALNAWIRIGYQTWESRPFGTPPREEPAGRPPGEFSMFSPDVPVATLTRTQIPLALAWALTVHKSQGMTLDRVTIDIWSAFAAGQAYTALSRARSLQGLKIKELTGRAVFSDDRVIEFGREISKLTKTAQGAVEETTSRAKHHERGRESEYESTQEYAESEPVVEQVEQVQPQGYQGGEYHDNFEGYRRNGYANNAPGYRNLPTQ